MDRTVIMESYKYDGRLHYRQPLRVVQQLPGHWVLHGEPGRILQHLTRQANFCMEKPTLEFFWNDRWYTVAVIWDENGSIYQYYCNIAMPARFYGDRVRFVDLDLDIVCGADLKPEIIDEEEFVRHARYYGYPTRVIAQCARAIRQLFEAMKEGKYPFNGSIPALAAKYLPLN